MSSTTAWPLALPLTGATPGLGSPEALLAFDALVAVNLVGPRGDLALAGFHDALHEYCAQVPEPGSLLLAAALVPLGPLAWRRRQSAIEVDGERPTSFAAMERAARFN